ncbi:MAG: TldD/PmbA family protein [Oscillospiraceae bacterium]|nr:TldD/PmbA family protein [Oscillospiraceae bacterium]
MNFQEFKHHVFARCEALGVADYELYYQTAESTSVSAYQHEINQFSGALEGGVCFRCISGGRMGYASTECLSAETAQLVVERALDNAACLEAAEPVFLGEGGKVYKELTAPRPELPSAEALVAKVLAVQEQLYAADPGVIDGCTTQGVAERSEIAIYNSRGLDLRDETTLVGLVAGAVVSDGKEMANDYQIALGKLDAIDTESLTKKAVRTALASLGGEPAPTGQYPVVFDPEAMSDLLSAFSSIFSAENVRKGLSRLAGQEGNTVAAPCVTVVDDPAYPGCFLQRSFDAEGSPTFRKEVISAGRLNTLLYDLKNAALAGRETTGNAAKANYDSPVGIRPFTLYLSPGSVTEEELLQKAGNGVYINALGGLHAGANAVSGDFSLQSAGFLLENGVKTARVKSFTVAGNFYDLLKNIVCLADDLTFPGMGTVGAPTTLVQGLTIAGK